MWRPGDDAPGEEELAAALHSNRHRHLPITKQRALLPIARCRDEILYAIETHATVVIVGETGSGKTTQLPQYLHEAGWTAGGRQVVCTQPRRLAATMVAQRVCEEMGLGELGQMTNYIL